MIAGKSNSCVSPSAWNAGGCMSSTKTGHWGQTAPEITPNIAWLQVDLQVHVDANLVCALCTCAIFYYPTHQPAGHGSNRREPQRPWLIVFGTTKTSGAGLRLYTSLLLIQLWVLIHWLTSFWIGVVWHKRSTSEAQEQQRKTLQIQLGRWLNSIHILTTTKLHSIN